MSLSVDDLAASLSNHHIGQEAIDLAALHAQLAQLIFTQQSGLSVKPVKQCNTPTSATMACSWNRVSPVDDMESQDERTVEELLIPASATQAQPNQSTSYYSPYPSYSPYASTHAPDLFLHCQAQTQSTSPTLDPSLQACANPSLFTSTDPFYMDQMQEMQRQARLRDGVLMRLGLPEECSPFMLGAQSH